VRTTVTLDADTEALLRQRMRAHRISFKQALNDAIRAGLATAATGEFHTEEASMGVPTVNLDRALHLAGELEDEELIRRMRAGA
jgi:predicted transcriptional regulator